MVHGTASRAEAARLRAGTFGARASELAAAAGALGVAVFSFTLYALPQHLFPVLEPLRVGVTTAALMAGGLVARWALGGAAPTGAGLRAIGLGALAACALLSPLWSFDPGASGEASRELLKTALVYVACASLLDTRARLSRALWAVAIAGSVPAYHAVSNYVTGTNLLEGYRARWVGTFMDPNRLAMSVTASALLLLALRPRARHPVAKLAVIALLGLQVAAVVVTYSRGATLGLATGFLAWFMLGKGLNKVRSLAILGVLGLGLLFAAPEQFWSRTESIASYEEDMSARGRLDAWRTALAVVEARPLTGVGAGAFVQSWATYAPGDALRPYVAHNLVLEIVAEYGVVALLGFLLLAGACLAGAIREARRAGPLAEEARGVAAALVGYLVCQMFAAYLVSFFLFLLLGLAAAVERVAARERRAAAGRATTQGALP